MTIPPIQPNSPYLAQSPVTPTGSPQEPEHFPETQSTPPPIRLQIPLSTPLENRFRSLPGYEKDPLGEAVGHILRHPGAEKFPELARFIQDLKIPTMMLAPAARARGTLESEADTAPIREALLTLKKLQVLELPAAIKNELDHIRKYYEDSLSSLQNRSREEPLDPKAQMFLVGMGHFLVDVNTARDILVLNPDGTRPPHPPTQSHDVCQTGGIHFKVPSDRPVDFAGEYLVTSFLRRFYPGSMTAAPTALVQIKSVPIQRGAAASEEFTSGVAQAGFTVGYSPLNPQNLTQAMELSTFLKTIQCAKVIKLLAGFSIDLSSWVQKPAKEEIQPENFYQSLLELLRSLPEESWPLELRPSEKMTPEETQIAKDTQCSITRFDAEQRINMFRQWMGDKSYEWRVVLSLLSKLPTEAHSLLFKNFRLKELCTLIAHFPMIPKIFPRRDVAFIRQHLPRLYEKFDRDNIAALYLGSILVDPQDGKPENYIVKFNWNNDPLEPEIESFEICCIDNDLSFEPPLWEGKLNMKSILWLLPMVGDQPVPSRVREYLLNQEPLELVLDWLTDNDRIHGSFGEVGPGIDPKRVGMPLQMRAGTLQRMIQRLTQLQRLLRENETLTLARIFDELEPFISSIYRTEEGSDNLIQSYSKLISKPVEALPGTQQEAEGKKLSTVGKKIPLGESIKEWLLELQDHPCFQEEDFRFPLYCKLAKLSCITSLETLLTLFKEDPLKIYHRAREENALDLIEICVRYFEEKGCAKLTRLTLPSSTGLLYEAIREENPELAKIALDLGADTSVVFSQFLQKATRKNIPTFEHLLANPNVRLSVEGVPLIYKLIELLPDDLHRPYLHRLAKKGLYLDETHTLYGTPLDYSMELSKPSAFQALILVGAGTKVEPKKAIAFGKKHNVPLAPLEATSPEVQWLMTLDTFFGSSGTPVEGMTLGSTHLVEEALTQIAFDSQKRIASSDENHGNHKVVVVTVQGHAMHLKEDPEMPGVEFAVGLLHEKLIGHGTPRTELLKIKDTKNQAFPLLASQTIPGENFEVVAKRNDPRIGKLHLHRLHNLMLVSMIIQPEDGKPDNFIFKPYLGDTFELVSIDNDHAFIEPYLRGSGQGELKIKNILFCLNQMVLPIHPMTRELFLKTDPKVLLTDWLSTLLAHQDRFLSLFSEGERSVLLMQKSPTSMVIPFPPGSAASLFERMSRMQMALRDHPEITPLALLQIVAPQIGTIYEKVIQERNIPHECFRSLFQNDYSQTGWGFFKSQVGFGTRTKSIQLFATRGVKDFAMRGNQVEFGPQYALDELRRIEMQSAQMGQAKDELLKGVDRLFNEFLIDSLRDKTIQLIEFKEISPAQGLRILQIMLESKSSFTHLHLENAPLRDEDLIALLKNSPYLTSLKLKNCGEITQKVIPDINRCEFLETLSLPKWESDLTISAKNLRILVLGKGSSLKRLEVTSPLQKLSFASAEKLLVLKLSTSRLETFDFRNCRELTFRVIEQIVQRNPNLTTVLFEGTPILTKSEKELARILPHFFVPIIKLRKKPDALKFLIHNQEAFLKGSKEGVLALTGRLGNSFGLSCLVILLPYMRKITKLDFSFNSIGPQGAKDLAHSLPSLTNLQKLNLGRNNIGPQGAKDLAHSLPSLTNLQKLNLRYNKIGDQGAKDLAHSLPSLTNLQQLYLSDNSIGPQGAKDLAHSLPSLTNLQQLDLASNQIGPQGAKDLAHSLPSLTNLQQLYFSFNSIGPQGAKDLAHSLPSLTNLQQLDLASNQIGPQGAKDLAHSLPSLTNLQQLYLSDNSIGPQGAKDLAHSLPSLTNLQQLNLSFNSIGPQGAKDLAHSLPSLTNLQKLNLSDNSIGPQGAKDLAHFLPSLTNLQQLNLSFNSISENEKEALRKSARKMLSLSL